jgi:cell division inhibitor SepF
MTLMGRIMSFFGMSEEDDQYEEEVETDPTTPPVKGRNNIVSLHTQKNIRLVLFEPMTYEDYQEIADYFNSVS